MKLRIKPDEPISVTDRLNSGNAKIDRKLINRDVKICFSNENSLFFLVSGSFLENNQQISYCFEIISHTEKF